MKWLSLLFLPLFLSANEPFFVTFTPPKDWVISDPSQYQQGIKIGFIESKKKVFSPSITLSVEKIGKADLKTYIKAVQKNFEADQFSQFQELGTLHTLSGTGTLIQVDMKNRYGEIRLLQAITIHQGYAIIHSAAVPKNHFLTVHQKILNAFKSLNIFPTVADSCNHPNLQEEINCMMRCWKKYRTTSKNDTETLFKSPFFQNNQWKPFVRYVENELNSQGSCWQLLAIKYIKETLLTENDS
ncbi:MAG: hypothetical protein KFB93_04700 [Simkaniaceae bacterium]|jgi:hypothetical protein|nr:MAG: hypothetical protein KFB93_04700 [Simkaniaceae bacterium]